ncbi:MULTISPECIES: hypothetical protein [Mycobacteriaceae]|uniref:Uncharacterized protein n=1 Tax=Mycolicibacterium parafortuitum TaxID=39692 RepID=A0ACC6MFV9_MYCPF|nr:MULTISPECIES: hypothetical protein [Mycobacteriaceae]MDZ5085768.1 hypothetical protein [Mycolicibacterium parafortuitum]
MLTGVARVFWGSRSTTVGVSAVARVASCSCMPEVRPPPSAGDPISRRAGRPQSAHGTVSGGALIG